MTRIRRGLLFFFFFSSPRLFQRGRPSVLSSLHSDGGSATSPIGAPSSTELATARACPAFRIASIPSGASFGSSGPRATGKPGTNGSREGPLSANAFLMRRTTGPRPSSNIRNGIRLARTKYLETRLTSPASLPSAFCVPSPLLSKDLSCGQ